MTRGPTYTRGRPRYARRRYPSYPRRYNRQPWRGRGMGFQRTTGYYGRFNRRDKTPELKFFDTDSVTGPISTTGLIQNSVCQIPRGAGESERIGRNAQLKKFGIKYTCGLATVTTADGTSDTVRIIVYLDKQTNGASATPQQILEDIGANADYQSFRNIENTTRFQTIMDNTHTLNATAGLAVGTGIVEYANQFYKDFNVIVEFDGATGNISEMRTNNIGILFITKAGKIDVQFTTRVRYFG